MLNKIKDNLCFASALSVISCFIIMEQMFFATSILHVRLMQWDDDNLVEQAVNRCNQIWESIDPDKVSEMFFSLLLSHFLLQTMHSYRHCMFLTEMHHDSFFYL